MVIRLSLKLYDLITETQKSIKHNKIKQKHIKIYKT